MFTGHSTLHVNLIRDLWEGKESIENQDSVRVNDGYFYDFVLLICDCTIRE